MLALRASPDWTADQKRKDGFLSVLLGIIAAPESRFERFSALSPYALVRCVWKTYAGPEWMLFIVHPIGFRGVALFS